MIEWDDGMLSLVAGGVLGLILFLIVLIGLLVHRFCCRRNWRR